MVLGKSSKNWAIPKEPTKEPTTRIEFLNKRRMKEMHCAPKGIETSELKIDYSVGKDSRDLGQRGKAKGERCLGGFRSSPI